MQEASSFKSRRFPLAGDGDVDLGGIDDMARMVTENAVIVIGRRGCCMCHVAKRLLLGLGANPAALEVDQNLEDAIIIRELIRVNYYDGDGKVGKELEIGCGDKGMLTLPVVFVGGKLFGGLDRVMATHISGELVSILKDAGALWL